jgi:hypothetical protein
MFSLTVINYFDVWGNKTDGYEVNDQRTVLREVTSVSAENEAIFDLLKSHDLLVDSVKLSDLEFIDSCSFVDIYEKSTGLPLYGINILEF